MFCFLPHGGFFSFPAENGKIRVGEMVYSERTSRRQTAGKDRQGMFESAYPEIVMDNGRMTVKLRGEIDHHTARPMREEIDRAVRRIRPVSVTLDLAEVTFMDSSGLGLILGRLDLAEQMGIPLSLRHVGERVARILRMGGLCKAHRIQIESEGKEASGQ